MTEEEFDELRAGAFAIAYRMLGGVSEAEDVVQEGFLRLHRARAGGERIASPRAYLSAVVSRLALDQLRSARVRRETYVGEWLPEPLVASAADDPARKAQMADSLPLASLVLLESLSPVQRAALLLREVFDEPYGGSRRSSARASRTPASSPHGPAATWRSGAPGSRPHASSGRSSRPASLRPSRRGISKGWRSCWPTTWSSAATAAARRPPPRVRCTAAPGWRACSSRGCGRSPASAATPRAARR